MRTNCKDFFFLILPFALFCGIVIIAAGYGSTSISYTDLCTENQSILFMRLNRIGLAFFAGCSLAMTGVVLQTLMHNPLASPYTLGISGIAALGATIGGIGLNKLIAKYISFSDLIPGFGPTQFLAFLTALLISILMVRHIRSSNKNQMIEFVLIGVVTNIMASSVILFLRYLLSPHELMTVDRFLMGNIAILDPLQILPLAILVIIAGGYFFRKSIAFDLISFGNEMAQSRGVDVSGLFRISIILSALNIAMVVSICGIISFVGLIVPHFIKLCGVYQHKKLIYYSSIYGGIFLIASDLVARTILSPLELPIGIITSFLGGGFFFYLLLKRKSY